MLPYRNGDAIGFMNMLLLPVPIIPPCGAGTPRAAASVALGVVEPNMPGNGMNPIPIVMFEKLLADAAAELAVEPDCARASTVALSPPTTHDDQTCHPNAFCLHRIMLLCTCNKRQMQPRVTMASTFDSADIRKTLKIRLFREYPVFVNYVKPEVLLFFPVSLKRSVQVTRSNESGFGRGEGLPPSQDLGGEPSQRDRTRRG